MVRCRKIASYPEVQANLRELGYPLNEHRGMRMIDRNWAEAFAREWVDAWNAHDLERILSHYRDNFEMASPLIVERMGVASGRLKGKEAIRRYWGQGLAGAPDLRFELTAVMVGVN